MAKIGGNVKIRKIAVTGALSAGKSTVCELLKAQGAYVLKADDIVHHLLSQNDAVIQKIRELFGNDVISQDRVDRNKLAHQVFSNSNKLKSLEDLLHPIVVKTIQETYTFMKNSPQYKAFVVEIPLLFEIHFESWFDKIVYVTADSKIRKNRFKGNDFELRSERFLKESEKLVKSDYIINNQGSLEELNHQIENIL